MDPFVATFNVLKSIQILSLSFFLGTTTMGDNHVASLTYWMNLVANNLSISCLTTVAWFGFDLYMAWCAYGIVISNWILWCASFNGISFRSLYVHAKTSLNSFNSCSVSNTLSISNCALIYTNCGFASIPELNFINCWFLINVHPTIYNSCTLIFYGISSTTTLLG
jgi:hypothetical protein